MSNKHNKPPYDNEADYALNVPSPCYSDNIEKRYYGSIETDKTKEIDLSLMTGNNSKNDD